jgi:hypothetical protein
MRPRVFVPDPSQFLLPFQGSVLQNRDHVACDSHTVFFTEVWPTTVAKIRTIASSHWPSKRSVQNFRNDLRINRMRACKLGFAGSVQGWYEHGSGFCSSM